MDRRSFLTMAMVTASGMAATLAGCGGGEGGDGNGLNGSTNDAVQTTSFVLGGQLMTVKLGLDANAVDSQGRTYAVDFDQHTLTAFDPQGLTLWSVGGQGIAAGQLNSPKDVELHPDGHLYVVDRGNARVQIYDAQGNLTGSLGSYGSNQGQFLSPHGIDFDDQGLVYVSDTHAHCVHVLTSGGQLVQRLGSFGLGGANLNGPTGMQVTSNHVYVVDTGNARVQVYDLAGNLLTSLGGPSPSQGGLISPSMIAVNEERGVVIVGDPATWSVSAFSTQGDFLGAHSLRYQSEPLSPTALNFDARGHLLVSAG